MEHGMNESRVGREGYLGVPSEMHHRAAAWLLAVSDTNQPTQQRNSNHSSIVESLSRSAYHYNPMAVKTTNSRSVVSRLQNQG